MSPNIISTEITGGTVSENLNAGCNTRYQSHLTDVHLAAENVIMFDN